MNREDNDLIFRECLGCGSPLARYEGSNCSYCQADIDDWKDYQRDRQERGEL